MKKNLLTLTFIFFFANLFAQTSVPGGSVSGTWTLAGSPYQVQGSIQVLNGATLTIQPGVTVEFEGTYKLICLGQIVAVGTSADSITFTAANTTNGWRGVRYESTAASNDTSKFFYCKFLYGNVTSTSGNDGYGGGLMFNAFSKAIISNSRISNCYSIYMGGAIACKSGSNVLIKNNKITNNTSAATPGIYASASNPLISGNVISYNASTVTNQNGGGIYCEYQNANPLIINNIISNNSGGGGGGIYCYNGSSPTIKNNVISNNTATGTSIYGSNGGGGIAFMGATSVIPCTSLVVNNTIVNNNSATSGGGIFCFNNANPTIRNTIIWGNTAATSGAEVFLQDDDCDPNIYYSDVQGGIAAIDPNSNIYSGTYSNNINSNPLFVSPSGGAGTGFNGVTANWALQNTSPCIDTGDPTMITQSTDISGNPRVTVCRIDMGAYEYQNGTPFAVSIAQTGSILCSGYTTGALQATASGSGSPYTYSWSTTATTSAISNLGANTYTVTASNSTGCTRTQTLTITEPAGMNITASQTNIDCSGNCIGSASVTVTGGTAPYTYSWSTGSTVSATASNLCSGPYTVTVTSTGGCFQTNTVTISSPGSLSFTTSKVNVNCHGANNGSFTVTPTGGTPPLNYSKDGGTNYQLSNSFTGLAATTYSVVVKDNNGCQTSITSLTITEPGVLTASITPTTINCYGATNGTAASTVTGGTSPFTYSWNSSPVQTTATASNLPLGNYTLSVTDSKGCTASASASIVSTLPAVPICLVTVDTSTSTKNVVVWEKPVTTAIDSFKIYREIGLNNFVRIGGLPYSALSQYTDTTNGVNPKIQSYRYKVSCVDSCGSESTLSAYHRTIHLSTPQFTPPSTFDLIWTNDYEGFSFSQYYILRDNNNNGSWVKIDSVTFGNLSYTDVGGTHPAPTDSARYIVEAAPASPCNVSIKNTLPEAATIKSSKSNTSDRTQNPVSVSENTLDNSISLFPNPNHGSFTLEIADYRLQIVKVNLYNMMGEWVYQASVTNPKTEIKIPGIGKGVYHLQIISGGQTLNRKIIIQ